MYDYTVTREALDRELARQGITGVNTDKLTISVQMAMMISRSSTGVAQREQPPPRCEACDD